MKMTKIGLIGTGFMGTTHAKIYEILMKKYDFKVTAITDLDPEKAKNASMITGAKIYANADELIENADVDTVDICLPTFLHAPYALKAMRKGLNAMIEKPVCRTEEEADELLAVQKETGMTVMVGQCLRFWDEYVFLKNAVVNNDYGKMTSAVLTRVSPTPTWSWEQWLMDDRKSGSAVLDLHIHDVDYALYLMGYPDSIKADIIENDGQPNHIFSTYKYGDAVVQMEGAWEYGPDFPFKMAFRVKFDEATVVYDSSAEPTLTVYPDHGTKFCPELKKEEVGSSDSGGNISSLGGYFNELEYFVTHLISGQPIDNATLADGVKAVRMVNEEIKASKR
jgi:predicted dehydrogenase